MCACVCSSKDEPWRHTLSEIKSVSKEQTRYDPTQMKYLEYSKRQKVEKWLPVVARETKGMELLFKGYRVSGMKDCHWTVHVKTVNYMGILHANFTTIKKKNAHLNIGLLISLFIIIASNIGPSRTTNSIIRCIRASKFLQQQHS